ncbi:MAG: family N-acetyltransferase [Paenibacillaceae bacterium]|jgi:GNAT superfamily N-acetyltransferase|nr:family N-acetyltransferase [Paenibacillaceae bacterium]
MPDMLVKLYNLPDPGPLLERLRTEGIQIKRAMTADKSRVVDFVAANFTANWTNECESTFARLPVNTFIAVKEKRIIGFASYDAIVRNYFGPTGVLPECRGMGVGQALLLQTMHAMHHDGYSYCIIGWVTEALAFYEKAVGAVAIPDSFPGGYKDLIDLG